MNALLAPRDQGLARRAMNVADLDAVLAVEASAYSLPWSRGNFIDSLAAGYVARVIYGERGEMLGYFIAMPGVDEMHLLNLTVAPTFQRQGHARFLLDELVAVCRERHAVQLWLEVRQSNERARALYLRYGFQSIGTRRGYYPASRTTHPSGREDAAVMSLQVEGADALE